MRVQTRKIMKGKTGKGMKAKPRKKRNRILLKKIMVVGVCGRIKRKCNRKKVMVGMGSRRLILLKKIMVVGMFSRIKRRCNRVKVMVGMGSRIPRE
jgi:hypothetical protein